MEKKLNLLGVRKLKLVEAVTNEDGKVINYQWVNEQLNKAGFPTKNINGNFQIGCKDPLLSILVTYDNSNNKVINEVEIQTLKQFPLIKQQTITLSGSQITAQKLKDTVLSLVPSSETLQEDISELPNQSMNNLNQFYDMKKYFEDTFKIKEDIISDDSGLLWELTYTKYLIRVVLDKGDKPYYEAHLKQKGANNNGKYMFNTLEDLMASVAKNLGVQDLTSKLYTDKEVEQEVQTEEDTRVFNRNANLTKEEEALRSQLSKEVQDILSSINEDYDRTNINVWNLAYSKCKSDKEKDILIQLFMNKKMNVKAEYIEKNFVGLRQWVNQRGFDIDKNLGLKFIDKYTELYPNQEIPSGSLIVLIELSNRNMLTTENPVLLNDTRSILYEKNIYNKLPDGYGDLIDILKMYYEVYNSNPNSMTQEKASQLINNFKFITEDIVKKPQELAYVMCIDNGNLRPDNTIETIFSIITEKTRNDIQDKEETVSLDKIIKDWNRDKKLDSLPETDARTLRLVQSVLNNTFNGNEKAKQDFTNNLNKVGNQ